MKRSVIANRLTAGLFLFAFLTTPAFAQSGRGWMNGFVFNEGPTKGLPSATVELVGDQKDARLRSVKLSTTPDDQGAYSLKDIPYGDYTFRVSAPGFASYQIEIYIAPDMLTQVSVRLRKKE